MAELTADVIIIGAGVHGASLAFHLSRRGVHPLVLERKFASSGATGRSSGLVRMHYDLEVEARLAWTSFDYFRRWPEHVGGECGFTRTGFLFLARPDHDQALLANIRMQQGLGIETQVVTAEQVAELAPAFVTDDFHLGAFEPESGYADPSATAAAFLVEARRLGTRVLPETAARGIVVESGRVRGVRTDRGRYSAPIVVNAAGAWAGPVGGMVGLELPLQTWRHDTAFLRRPASLAVGHPTVIDDVLSMYFRPETGGLTLVGLEDGNPLGRSPEEPTETPLPGFVTRAVDRICRRIPEMEKGSLHSSHGGFDGLTPDQRPILGPAGPEGFFLDCGFSGTGFKIAPAVGAAMAEWILDGYPSIVDVTGFGLARFERGEHLHGENPYAAIWR